MNEEDEIFNFEDDFMELGDSGMVPTKDGWILNKDTSEKMDPDGRIFDMDGEMIFDPEDFSYDDFEGFEWQDDDYEWYIDDEG